MQKSSCGGCGQALSEREGLETFGLRYCSSCFISEAGKYHRPLGPGDLELLKTIGREAAGHLPPDLVRMLAVGFYRRITGRTDGYPSEEDLARFVGEIQRLAMFSAAARTLNLLKTWHDTFSEFVAQNEAEIKDTVRRLTED